MRVNRFLGILAILAALGGLTLVSYLGVGSAGVRAAPAFTACAATSTASLVTSGTAVATGTVVATGTAATACTPVAAATSSVATTTTLRASPILARHVMFARHGRLLTFHWRMVMQAGIKGYRLFARHHPLTREIKPHHSPFYRVRVRYNGKGPFFLKVLTRYGKPLRIHASH